MSFHFCECLGNDLLKSKKEKQLASFLTGNSVRLLYKIFAFCSEPHCCCRHHCAVAIAMINSSVFYWFIVASLATVFQRIISCSILQEKLAFFFCFAESIILAFFPYSYCFHLIISFITQLFCLSLNSKHSSFISVLHLL